MKFRKRFSLLALLLSLCLFCGLFTSCNLDDISNAIDIADSIYNEISDILIDTSDENTTAAPADSTDGSDTVAETAADTTAKAVTTTKAAETTAKPAETTAKPVQTTSKPAETTSPETEKIAENGIYTSKEDVALYIYTYGKLPSNFITKSAAQKAGWSGNGSDALDNYSGTKNKCIGGDTFGNYEGVLPKKSGRTWKECDIDTLHASQRGVKRIVFSNDGLIYYTEDHYTTFTLLYGTP